MGRHQRSLKLPIHGDRSAVTAHTGRKNTKMNNETGNQENATAKKNSVIDLKIELTFDELLPSKWNASYGLPQDTDYINDLAGDIKRNDLLHPVTLIKNKTGPGYYILAGVKRVAALTLLRGEKSGLANGEYRVRMDLDETNPRCFDVSASENQLREEASPQAMARFVRRLIQEQGLDQDRVAKTLKLHRPTVNRLVKLDECFAALPGSWQRDLQRRYRPGMQVEKPAITFSHWYEVAGVIRETNVVSEIRDFLDKAHNEEWSTRQLKRELEGLDLAAYKSNPNPTVHKPGAAEQPTATAQSSKPDEISLATRAHKALLKALDLLKQIHAFEQVLPPLQEAEEFIKQGLGVMSEEEKARKAEEKAARKAAKKAERAKGSKAETKEDSEG